MLCVKHQRRLGGTGWRCAYVGLAVVATMVGCSSADEGGPTEPAAGGSSSVEGASGAGTSSSDPNGQTTPAAGGGGATSATGGTAGTTTGTGGTTETTGTGGTTESTPPPEITPPDDAVFFDDFENGAGNWTITQGFWTPTADATTVFTSSNEGNEARALAGDMTWTDMTVSGSVKITQMDDGRRIYLAARYIDSNNWYGAALYNSGDRKAQIRKKSAGSSSDISSVPFQFELNTWYRIELSIAGSELSLRVDDVPMTSGTDTEFAAGGIAVLADRSEVSWDDIVVTIP
jgi:hypothetical protein